MKIIHPKKAIITVLIFALGRTSYSQSTFQNLDFENPILPLSVGFVSAANAFPGWTVYSAVVGYDTLSLGGPAVTLQDANGVIPILQGNYTAGLQPNYPGGDIRPAIGQVGTIPSTAQSVQFYGNGNYTLTFGGQPIPLVVLASRPNYNIFGGSISAFDNQTGELRIQGGGSLDNIFFSPQAIPEPSTIGVFTFGALLLGWRFLCKRL